MDKELERLIDKYGHSSWVDGMRDEDESIVTQLAKQDLQNYIQDNYISKH